MYNIKHGYGCGIKATLLTASGEVCDLRRARYKGAVLVLPNGSTIPCADVSVDDITNTMYVRLLGDRELTTIGRYGILFNVKLANGVMYSSPIVMFADVQDDAEMEYRELNISIAVTVTYLPANVAYTGASPKISPNGTWLVYNDELNAYEDTGEPASYAGVAGYIQELHEQIEERTTTTYITEAVDVDWKTVGKNAEGKLCVIGGDTQVADFIEGYLLANGYAKLSELAKIFASIEWIEGKKYITDADIPSLVSAFTNDKGYITLDAIAPYAKKATTLGGYGITNAYTKEETESRFFAFTKIDNETIKRNEDGFMYVDFSNVPTSIFDGLPIDNQTLQWQETENGKILVAVGGGGGGGVADSVAWANVYGKPTWITNAKPTYNYSEIQGTPDLSGYALASAIPTNNNQLTNGAGYITAEDTVANANKLGGYLPTTYMRASGQYTDSLNDLTSLGIYRMAGTITDGPSGAGGYGNLMVIRSNSWDTLSQLYFNANNHRIFVRSGTNSNLPSRSWETIAFTSDIPSLTGYATQTFVNTAVNGAKEWVEEQQYLTEITSGMIESVLGYQPYDGDTNSKGFLTASALNGYATQSWVNTALAGYLPLSGGVIAGRLQVGADDNSRYNFISTVRLNHAAVVSNNDEGAYFNFSSYSDGVLSTKKMIELGVNDFRYSNDGGKTFNKILHSGNINSYNAGSATKLATPRTIWGQSFDGTGNVTGDMSGVGKFSANDNGYLTDISNGDIAISLPVRETGGWTRGFTYKHLSNEAAFGNLAGVFGEGTTLSYYFYGGGYGTGSHAMRLYDASQNYKAVFNGNVTAPTFTGNLVGNADSANKLATSRKIWGQSFDGTGDMSGDLSLYPQTQGLNVSSGVLRFHSASNAITGPSIKGVQAPVGYGAKNLVFYQHNTGGYTEYEAMRLTYDGNLVIGGTTANAKLHVYGNLLTEGGITMYSQRSLKNILSYEGLSLEQLSVIKPIKFTWKDGRDNRYHVGGVADDVATVVPEVVYSADDFLTMDYGNAGFYVAASLIKPVLDHEQRIKILEQENKALREEINQLRQSA